MELSELRKVASELALKKLRKGQGLPGGVSSGSQRKDLTESGSLDSELLGGGFAWLVLVTLRR